MIEFRQKNFGILSDTVTGAALGGTVAGTGALFRNKFYKGDQAHENNQSLFRSDLFLTTSGLVIGAALGALVGGIKEIATKVNRRNTVDRRLMSKVVEILKKDGLKEGTNYTKDPKTASSLKTKVCVVISKVSGDLRISVNLVSDPKLKTVSDEIIKRLPNTSATTEKCQINLMI